MVREALGWRGVSVVDVRVDYTHVAELMGSIIGKEVN